jgi:gas vesicle protein
MMTSRDLYKAEFDKLYTDASYSASTYYEASKGASLLGRTIVFFPALLAAISSMLILFGLSTLWGIVGVASGIVTATSSFLGADRKADEFRKTGNSFTKLRHEARMWRDVFVEVRPEEELVKALKDLRGEYNDIVDDIELPANIYFKKASRRIEAGVFGYSRSEIDGKNVHHDATTPNPGNTP